MKLALMVLSVFLMGADKPPAVPGAQQLNPCEMQCKSESASCTGKCVPPDGTKDKSAQTRILGCMKKCMDAGDDCEKKCGKKGKRR
jgi:hypothetical protein